MSKWMHYLSWIKDSSELSAFCCNGLPKARQGEDPMLSTPSRHFPAAGARLIMRPGAFQKRKMHYLKPSWNKVLPPSFSRLHYDLFPVSCACFDNTVSLSVHYQSPFGSAAYLVCLHLLGQTHKINPSHWRTGWTGVHRSSPHMFEFLS